MNYIHRLQEQIKELEEERREAAEILGDLQIYLGSEKFWNDTTVQVQDIRNRLAPLQPLLDKDLPHGKLSASRRAID